MKALSPKFKRSAVFTAMFLFAAACFAQKSVRFKMEYLPAHKYLMDVNTQMDMTMDLKGDSADAIKPKGGTPFPMKIAGHNLVQMEIISGARPSGSALFPLTMKYTRVESHSSMNGADLPSPKNELEGMELKGHAGGSSLFEMDTTSNKPMGQGMTTALLGKLMNNMLQQIKFPEKPMIIGDTFDQPIDIPFSIPQAGTMNFEGKTTYKLIAVNSGIADFDVVIAGILNLTGNKNTAMKMTGKMNGTGKIKFSEADHFFTDMTNDIAMSYNVEIQGMNMAGDMKMLSTYKVNIAETGK